MSAEISVTEQLMKTQEFIRRRYKAQKFIVYFQNYTNTYLPLGSLRKYMEEAAKLPDIVEIAYPPARTVFVKIIWT